ncbi:MAG: DNA modification methylase [Planctomycetota bacterium]
MNIQTVPISRINPAPYNPRVDLKPTDPAYRAIVSSLDEFGCVEPLIWNSRTGHLVGGHQRLKVIQARGDTEVTVSVVDLPETREKALNLALNKVGGRWDRDLLTDLLADLSQAPGLDLDVTGFQPPEIEDLLADRDGDACPEPDGVLSGDEEPITQRGELITLGRHGEHRLLCGDATMPDDLDQLFGEDRASLCFTDPPYGVAYDRTARPAPRKKGKITKRVGRKPSSDLLLNDDLSASKYRAWLAKVLDRLDDRLAPGRSYYIWNGHKQFGLMHDQLTERGFKVSAVIAWAKESFSPGFGDFNEQVEFCLYGWRGGARHRFFGPKTTSTLWNVPRDRTGAGIHPTQKPLELAERALRYSSKKGEIIYDPFLGSGTTLIAAARRGRRCYGLEIEPKYCDLIVRRYIRLAGTAAVPKKLVQRYGVKKRGQS